MFWESLYQNPDYLVLAYSSVSPGRRWIDSERLRSPMTSSSSLSFVRYIALNATTRPKIEYPKNEYFGCVYYVKTPLARQPRIPPRPVAIHEYEIRSYEPCSGSFLACIHIIASDTTFTKASLIAAIVKQIETPIAEVSCSKYIDTRATNYKIPIMTIYDFLLVPAIGILSLISPYMILIDHGIWIIDIYIVIWPGLSFRYYLNKSWQANTATVQRPWLMFWIPRRITNGLSYFLQRSLKNFQ